MTSTPAGITCGSGGNDCTEDYPQEQAVSLSPVPDTGSVFGGWSGDSDCSDGVVTMSGERNCTATFSAQPSGPAAPELLAPINNAAVVQNNPSIGCSLNPDRGYGFEIAFDWTDVAAAVEYDLFAIHRGAPLPLVDTQVSGSDHTNTRCNSFVTDSNLDDWDWRVRARDAQGNTGNWSQTATFRFEPCRLAGGGSCSAPPPPPPPPSGPVTLFFQDTENPDQISTAGDMLSALVEFNLDTGAFQVTWTADPGNPFNGDLILNLNLGNLRLGGNLLMLSRTFSAVSSTTQLSYTGTNAALTSWLIGDEITTHGSSPPFNTSFNSGLVDQDDTSHSNRDLLLTSAPVSP